MPSKETTGPGRILVVEDEAIIAADLAETLGSMGYDVVATVDTAEDAIVNAADLVPDIVLMDVRLAGAVDGIEAAATIKQRADIPVIFLTAHSDDETLTRAIGTAPLEYLVKPFRASELRDAIELALHKHDLDSRLQEREHWLAGMIRSIGDAVIATDPDHRVTFLNPVAQTVTGWTESAAIGKPLDDILRLVGAKTGAPIESPLRRAIAARTPEMRHGDAAVVARTGTVTPVDDSAIPIFDDQGRVLGVVVVFRDVSEHARIEGAMRRLAAELKARIIDRTSQPEVANHELAAYRSSVAQGLWAPRRGQGGRDRLVIDDPAASLDAEVIDHLKRIRDASPRMGALLEDLIELAGVARTELCPTEVDLSALATDILGRLAPARGVRVTLQEAIVAHGDRRLLRSVLAHLLANAWKFTAKVAAPEIMFGRSEGDGAQVYFVRDNGIGFDMKDAPQLFGAFQRLHPAGEFAGSGIGLALVQRIIHRHGGRVWAEGKVGHGATFSFTLRQGAALGGSSPAGTR